MTLVSLEARSARIDQAITALQKGRFVLLYDADGREEETDLVVASQFVSPAHIRQMRAEAGGLICTTVHPDFHEKIRLPFLSDVLSDAAAEHPLVGRLVDAAVPYEGAGAKPSFGLSVNHRETFTGVTDNDRALTISRLAQLVLASPQTRADALQDRFAREFKTPGHVFLLNARPGLLDARKGHTELSTALLELAGLAPTATICEMMNGPSGRALPKADAIKYAAGHGLVFLEGTEVVTAWQRMARGRKPA